VKTARALSLLFLMASTSPAFAQKTASIPVRVLAYDSLTGKGSLGEWIESEFPKFCGGCSAKLVSTKENAGLLGRLRADRKRGARAAFDVVLGLEASQYGSALQEKLVDTGRVFDRGAFAIVVDTKKLAEKDWPKSWAEVPTKLAGKLLIEDPRLSAPGVGWLRAIFEMKAISTADAKKTVARVFPSWSSAYGAFLEGEGSAVWSYVTSEAYHRCNEKKPEDRTRYRAIPLKEGYPVHEDYVAAVARAQRSPNAERFVDFVLSKTVQDKVGTLNWMFPADRGAKVPDCFSALPQVVEWNPGILPDAKDLRRWTDEWSL
jgi:thiamine transport system substrate-binding protein